MNSAKDATKRLRTIICRCSDCRVNRVPEQGMLCPWCQRLTDNRKLADARARAYIQAHGQEAWDQKLKRETEELY